MINIPCQNCGCQYCDAETKNGDKVRIEICRCEDGSGEFDVSIIPNDGNETTYEKYKCNSKEIEECLVSRFKVNLESMNHQCFN